MKNGLEININTEEDTFNRLRRKTLRELNETLLHMDSMGYSRLLHNDKEFHEFLRRNGWTPKEWMDRHEDRTRYF